MSRVLVVDDKEMMRDSVSTSLVRAGHTVVTAPDGKAALEKIAARPVEAVITDLQMPGMTGVELIEEIRKLDEQIPVIVMTAYGTIETAVAAMKNGAFDYITKPFTGDVLMLTVQRALEHQKLVKDNAILRASVAPVGTRGGGHAHAMIGDGPTMTSLRDRLSKIADSATTVLISGESGSGKEVAARWIHEHSARAKQPFLALNCAALSTSLLESELFGHEKGAFTGADRLRKGRFELADGGTLLLDEISEISPGIQAKLLRVLQERAFERVGSSTTHGVDVRVIATTNRNLPAEVAAGRFRQDLYFRLNVLPLPMPPLRDHAEDIPALVEHFLDQQAAREGKPPRSMETAAIDVLKQYRWPGNVRELMNICERAAVLATDDCIRATLLAPWLSVRSAAEPSPVVMSNGSRPASMIEIAGSSMADASDDLPEIICDGDLTLADVEREVIVATLHHHRGHRQKSASALGIGVRTLGLKLKKWKEEHLVAPNL